MKSFYDPCARVAMLFALTCLSSAAPGQSDKSYGTPATATPAAPAKAKVSPYHSQHVTYKAEATYLATWGVDKLKVGYTNAGNLIRFSYRVVNTVPAKALGNKTSPPYLVGLRAHAVLQVPTMEQVGMLRQTAAEPKAGAEYWMVFSNKGNLVRPGDRVNVVIGSFHADNLMVE